MLRARLVVLSFAALLAPAFAGAQGTVADYRRAMELRDKVQALPVNVPEPATWIDKTTRFWYRRSVKEGAEFVLVDASTQAKRPAFDHQRLADVLNAAIKPPKAYTAITLPFNTFSFVDGEEVIQFSVDNVLWRCRLADYTCPDDRNRARRQGRPRRARRRRARGSGARRIQYQRCGAAEIAGRQVRGSRRQLQRRHPRIRQARGDAAEHGWFRGRLLQSGLNRLVAGLEEDRGLQDQARVPPLRALRGVVSGGPAPAEAQHAPVRQARRRSRRRTPVIFDVENRKLLTVEDALFPNAYDQTSPVWRKDSSAVTFEYNQRGHQVYRVIEVDAATGAARAVVSEETKTFFYYSGKKYRFDVARRAGSDLDVGARRLEPPLSLRRPHRRGEEPDHEGRVAGARRPEGRRGEAADLVQRQRHVSGQGSVLRPLLPHQLRRHRPDARSRQPTPTTS